MDSFSLTKVATVATFVREGTYHYFPSCKHVTYTPCEGCGLQTLTYNRLDLTYELETQLPTIHGIIMHSSVSLVASAIKVPLPRLGVVLERLLAVVTVVTLRHCNH